MTEPDCHAAVFSSRGNSIGFVPAFPILRAESQTADRQPRTGDATPSGLFMPLRDRHITVAGSQQVNHDQPGVNAASAHAPPFSHKMGKRGGRSPSQSSFQLRGLWARA